MRYYVYILYAPDYDRYYKGQTQNLSLRLKRHQQGTEKSTAPYRPWILVWFTVKASRGEAIRLEAKLKTLSKGRIQCFIRKYPPDKTRQ